MKQHTQTAHECIAMHREGYSTWEVLEFVASEGFAYEEAVTIVTRALRLDDESVADMEDRYTDCI
jgi:hypothetical protein